MSLNQSFVHQVKTGSDSVRISDLNSRTNFDKIQPNTLDFDTRLKGLDPTTSAVRPQGLVPRSIGLGSLSI